MKYNLFLVLLCIPCICLAQPGTRDNNFSADGYQFVDYGAGESANDGAVQADQKILVCGSSNVNSTTDAVVTRLFPDGSIDNSFGTNGTVFIDNGGTDVFYAIALQADGKIVLVGHSSSDFLIVRLNVDGSLDNSFDFDGKLVIAVGSGTNMAYDIEIFSDNKIIVCGSAYEAGTSSNVAVVRLNPDGSLDNTFSFDGIVTTDIDQNDGGRGLFVQANGRITVVGNAGSNPMLVRYDSDGVLDNTFGTNGVVVLNGGTDSGLLKSVVYDGDGRINVAGYLGPGSGNDVMVARLNYDGTLDISFSSDGVVFYDFAGNTDDCTDLVIQPDGKLLVCGYVFSSVSWYHTYLQRYNVDGTLDASFGTNGTVIEQPTGSDRYAAIALQADGKVVTFGLAAGGVNTDILVGRYLTGLNIGIGEVDAYIGSTLVYPNPITNNQVTIEYELKSDESVSIELFDLSGKVIAELQPTVNQKAGSYQRTFAIPTVAVGNYLMKLNTLKGSVSVKLTVN